MLVSVRARFAVGLPNRAEFDLATLSARIWTSHFKPSCGQRARAHVDCGPYLGLFFIFGFALVIYPKWLQENCNVPPYQSCI